MIITNNLNLPQPLVNMAEYENLGGIKMDLNQFLEWQRAGKSRSVNIELGHPRNQKHIKVWAYDYELGVGQHVKSTDEIDLEAEKAKEEKAEYERLKKKFEDKKSD